LMAKSKYASPNMYFEPKKLTLKNGDKVVEKKLSVDELDVMKENGTIDFEVKDNDNIEVEMLGNSFGTFTYVLKLHNIDPNVYDSKNHTHYFEFYTGVVKYYKLIEENDGKRVYYPNDINCSEEKAGTDECTYYEEIKVDLNNYTTIYYPIDTGYYYEYKGNDKDFVDAYITNGFGSSSQGLIGLYQGNYSDRIIYGNLLSLNSIKVIKKTDQEGRPTDASFNVTYLEEGGVSIDQANPDYAGYKFTFKHYDELEINGEKYKNVYLVNDIIPKDEDDKDSIINTKNGEAILYYPTIISRAKNSNGAGRYVPDYFGMFINEIDSKTGYLKNEESYLLSAKGFREMLVVPQRWEFHINRILLDDFSVDSSVKEYWNQDGVSEEFLGYVKEHYDRLLINIPSHISEAIEQYPELDSWKQTRTVVNKKVPTIKKTVEGNGPKDKEYTFLVYDKESNELVETIKVKANEEGYLDITKLVNGKTYIIREKIDSEDYTNTKIEVLNGEAQEDKDGKYYEFTYDEELTKVYEANFYNKYKESTVPDTGDNIIIFIVLGIVSLVSILLVVLKLKKVNK